MRKHLLLAFNVLLVIGFASFLISPNEIITYNSAVLLSKADNDLIIMDGRGVGQFSTFDLKTYDIDCVNPTAQYEVVSNCQFGEQFTVETEITSLGGGGNVIVSDNMGSTPQEVASIGTVITFGPFPNGVNVIVSVTNMDDETCKTQSENLTQTYCPTEYITVDDGYTAENLVIDVLIDNPCDVVSNVTSFTGTDIPSDGTPGIGYFSAENTSFGLTSGIILSSGNVNNASGPETSYSGGGFSWPGDGDLDDLTASQGGTAGTYNASIIEFDFVSYTDQISFDYVFASAEYGFYQCFFADSFGFFLTDQAGNTENIALVPNTSTPVSVTSIRDNTYNSDCNSVNPEYFDKYYGPLNGLPGVANPISYRGYTVKLTAIANVVPGQIYHIKLAIADYSDIALDSAVFLQAGSFELGSVDLGPDLTIDNQNAPCEGSSAILDSGIDAGDIANVSWYLDNESL